MAEARFSQRLLYALVCMLVFLEVHGYDDVPVTTIDSAVAEGAVCLDGSPPAYQFEKGFGDGANNWLIQIQGGAWCNTVKDCLTRASMFTGSSKMMKSSDYLFSGILSNQKEENPNFYNWNRIAMRYCDGASFTGDVEEVDPVTNLHFRGERIFNAIVKELLDKGMKSASNALLSGSSAGGLASILHCDKFQSFFPSTTRVKCLSDAGFFAHAKDLSGGYVFENFYDQVVTLHGSAKNLPPECTSKTKPSLCFYAQYVLQYIKTPIFIVSSSYDSYQVKDILAAYQADPLGTYNQCKQNITQCSASQIIRLQEFRSDYLDAFSVVGQDSNRGWFIVNCYNHGLAEYGTRWNGLPGFKLGDKTSAEAVGDWFYDRSIFRNIDNQNVLPHYCL